MKKFAALVVMTLVSGAALAQEKPAEPAKPVAPQPTAAKPVASTKLKLEDLQWLSGCWKGKAPKGANLQEWWSKPTGNLMMGMGFEIRNGKYVSYEHMRIEMNDAGEIVFTAKPYKKQEASFTLTSSTAANLIFESSRPEFPQRVIYRQEKDGSYEARVDGMVNGQKHAALFPMEKMPCE